MNAQMVIYPVIILLSSAAIMSPLNILEEKLKFKQLKLILTIFSLTLCLILLLTLHQQVSSEGHIEAFLYGFGLPFGVQIYVDEFSVYMAVIFCCLGLLVAIFSYRYMEVDTGLDKYYGLLLTLITGMVGVAFAGDLFNLYVFWELMCISSYSLVSFRKYRWEAVEAGFKYLVMSTIGSLVALYGISIIYGCFKTVNMREIAMQLTLAQTELNSSAILSLYFATGLIICGFAVTAALVPFHTWLPDAHPAAPASMSAMLSGVVIKTGIYAMTRILFTVFTVPPLRVAAGVESHLIPLVDYGVILTTLGVVTITVANFMVLRQRDIKRFLAYSSIVNMGYIASGLGIAAYLLYHYSNQTYELAVTAASGAILHILNHAIGKGLLFLSSGCIVHEAKTRDIAKIEGIGRKMPWTGLSLTIGLFHLAGVPPLAGFWSKLLIVWGGLSRPQDLFLLISTLIIIVNSVYAAGYYLWLMQRLMLSKFGPAVEKAHEAPLSMVAPIVALALACILLTILLPWILPMVKVSTLALLGGG
jgi:multicomponent Na+:H+ antiporter subunit D